MNRYGRLYVSKIKDSQQMRYVHCPLMNRGRGGGSCPLIHGGGGLRDWFFLLFFFWGGGVKTIRHMQANHQLTDGVQIRNLFWNRELT